MRAEPIRVRVAANRQSHPEQNYATFTEPTENLTRRLASPRRTRVRCGWPSIDAQAFRVLISHPSGWSGFRVRHSQSGIEENNVDGVRVRVTSPARTVVDCFKFRNRIGVDVALEALRDYRRLRKGTVDELWRQADRLRMTRVIRPYWDAMSS